MSWIDASEAVLTQFQTNSGIPYSPERFETDENNPQLPDTYITYFLVDDPAGGHNDNVETSHEPRLQVSLFYRDTSIVLTVPDQIESAFIAAGFKRVSGGRLPYQEDTRQYGWRCDFRFYERR